MALRVALTLLLLSAAGASARGDEALPKPLPEISVRTAGLERRAGFVPWRARPESSVEVRAAVTRTLLGLRETLRSRPAPVPPGRPIG